MRATNKAANGKNWTIRQLKGRTQLTMKLEDGSKPSVLTEIPWQPDKATEILNAIVEVRSFVKAGESLQEANQKRLKALGKESGKAPALRKFDWSAAADAFLESMEGRRGGTLADLKIRVRRFKLTIKSKPAPTDGPSLMRAFAKLFFDEIYPNDHKRAGQLKMPPGGDGRRRNMQDVARILDYGVEEMGAPERWRPLSTKKRKALVGAPVTTTENSKETIPLLPEDFEALLDNLEADSQHEMGLAVGLIGFYGLRESELAVMRLDDNGNLYVGGQVKRGIKEIERGDQKGERLVKPLEIKGRAGLGKKMATLWNNGHGLYKLPEAVLTQIDQVEDVNGFKAVGAAFAQKLRRYRYWKILTKKIPGLTVNGLRHGWAWRAHKYSERPLHYSQAAKLMGHTTRVHLKYYSAWVNDQELEQATERFNQAVESVAL